MRITPKPESRYASVTHHEPKPIFQHPQTTRVQCFPMQVVTRLPGKSAGQWSVIERTMEYAPGMEFIEVHCDICNSTWTRHEAEGGGWHRDGAPRYTGGILDRKLERDRRYRVATACRCDAGRRMESQGVPPCDNRTFEIYQRIRKWRRIASRRMVADSGVEMVLKNWPSQAVDAWAEMVNRIMASGAPKVIAMKEALVAVGNDFDRRRLLP